RAFGDMKVDEHILLIHDDVKAVNTEENPNNVAPVKGPGGIFEDGKLKIWLPKLSWNVIRLAQRPAEI
ncbi:MAG: alpha-N-arabinofuranosidase, partial [Clostridia bacterium]|nr:alpha-N-arabinofuranosidase [Clostridia bacterium]